MPKKKTENNLVIIGQIMAPFGINGELKVKSLTDFPERFTPGLDVEINGKRFSIEQTNWYKGALILKLNTITSRNDAEKLGNSYLTIPERLVTPLPEGSYYYYELVGLMVKTIDGQVIGRIKQVQENAANDIYVVQSDNGEILLPAVKEIIKSIDLKTKTVIIEPIPGLLELNRKDNPKKS